MLPLRLSSSSSQLGSPSRAKSRLRPCRKSSCWRLLAAESEKAKLLMDSGGKVKRLPPHASGVAFGLLRRDCVGDGALERLHGVAHAVATRCFLWRVTHRVSSQAISRGFELVRRPSSQTSALAPFAPAAMASAKSFKRLSPPGATVCPCSSSASRASRFPASCRGNEGQHIGVALPKPLHAGKRLS